MQAFPVLHTDTDVSIIAQRGLNTTCRIFDKHQVLAVSGSKGLFVDTLYGGLNGSLQGVFDAINQRQNSEATGLRFNCDADSGFAALAMRRCQGAVL